MKRSKTPVGDPYRLLFEHVGHMVCTLATNSVTYPYVLPAASTAPTATKMYSAAANTGLGNQTVTPTWRLSVPASTFAGAYTSTWTISLVSGP